MVLSPLALCRFIAGCELLADEGPRATDKITNEARMRNAGWVLIIGLLSGCTTTSNRITNRQALNAGYQSLAAKDYEGAMARAGEFLQRQPEGPGSAEAMYLQGRVYEQRAEEDAAAGRDAQA